MNRRFFSIALITALFAVTFASCDKDDTQISPSEIQKEAIIAELGKNSELSEFVGLLKTLNIADIETDRLTVFAVRNAGMSKSALKSAADDGVVLGRHIVEGSHTKSSLTDSLKITALDGTILLITIIDGVYYVNGIEIGTEIPADNSIAYIVDMALRAKPIQRYSFNVYECNPAWSPDNKTPYLSASGAVISIRDGEGSELGTFTADDSGKVDITFESGTYFYKVTKGDASNIRDGFLISGIITSPDVIDTIPNAIPSVLGGLLFSDLNGDGIFDEADKPVGGYVRLQSIQDVYIAAADFAPTYRRQSAGILTKRPEIRYVIAKL